jgi:Holliday junction resolvasome RuvABC endonuclease subunit
VTLPEVIGIDPSLKRTGLCFPDGSMAVIATGDAHRGDHRLHDLRQALRYYLRSWPAQLAVIEVPAQFKSGDAALAAGMAQGIVRELLVEFQVPFGKIHPSTLKLFAVGRGSGPDSDKAHMVAACNRHRENDSRHWTARSGEPEYVAITDDNEADAWWLRQMGLWYLGRPDELDPSRDSILNSTIVRDAAVKGPKGVKWPGR